jgi:DNA polymerase (family 10)
MTNREIARTLDRIADLLQIKDENPFKVGAYRKAANSIYHLDEDLHIYYRHDRIGQIPGVGKAVKAVIEELLEKGSSEYYQYLTKDIPEGVLEFLRIPGLGHKTARLIYEHLGINNLDDLLKAAQERKIRTIPGLGSKTEYNIKKGMDLLRQSGDKITLGLALPIAQQLVDYLAESPFIQSISLVGSLRRGKPLVSDIDILAAASDFDSVKNLLKSYREFQQVLDEGPDHIAVQISLGIKVELIMVEPQDYYAALVWTTGSKEFRGRVFEGLEPAQFTQAGSEEEVFKALQMSFIPPEMRENKGEIELAHEGTIPALVEASDLKGDLHIHSEWSDGGAKIQETIAQARSLGYSYIAITDHSKSLTISSGLNEERLSHQGKIIDALNQEMEDFRVLKGIEVDILKNGRLDFDDEVLEGLDVVIASIHSNFKLDKEKQTDRIIQAMKNEHVDIIGHLTGRLLNRRSGYQLDLEPVLEAAAKYQVALEINSHPDRLDIDEDTARQAKDLGIKVAINSDAHHREDLKLVHYGVLNARRGWLQPEDVLNTMDYDRLVTYLKNKGTC